MQSRIEFLFRTGGAILLIGPLGAASVGATEKIELSWPIACELGQTCFVQNFFDHEAGAGAKDFGCGSRTYDGHDGTDIRLTDTRAEQTGVDVLAAADGRVTRTRDGVDDISIRITGKAAVAGKECGNGLVIEHRDGWSTQYCHMQNGSIAVVPGQTVKAGTRLGKVGLSGETEVPHLHLTVRYNNAAVDPFAYDEPPNACSGGQSLWLKTITASLQYREREIINFGFAGIPATMESVESGILRDLEPDVRSDVVVAYVRSIGLRKRDEQMISVRYPDGTPLAEYHAPPLPSDKAEFFVTAGVRKTRDWPRGTYTATFRVVNEGVEKLAKDFSFEIKP